MAQLDHIFDYRIIAMRGLHKDLGDAPFPGGAFKLLNRFLTLLLFNRQVTVKRKLLSVEPRSHQRQKYGRRSDKRPDRDILRMGHFYKVRARIRHYRAAGFG